MSLRIQNNVEAYNANRQLENTSNKMSKAMERLVCFLGGDLLPLTLPIPKWHRIGPKPPRNRPTNLTDIRGDRELPLGPTPSHQGG